MFTKFDLRARIVENVCLGGKYYRIRVEAPEIASQAQPGQFCMIRPVYSGESLLRRPFSIAAVRDKGLLEFAYTAIGIGTRLISQSEPGIIYCASVRSAIPFQSSPAPGHMSSAAASESPLFRSLIVF